MGLRGYGDRHGFSLSSTGGLGHVRDPFALTDYLVDDEPAQLIPYTDEELEKNNARDLKDRWALWPLSPVAIDNSRAALPFLKIHHRGVLDFTVVETGMATVEVVRRRGAPPTLKVTRERQPLFTGRGTGYRPTFCLKNQIYHYTARSQLARVRLDKIKVPTAYEFWTGSEARWAGDPAAAVPVCPPALNTADKNAFVERSFGFPLLSTWWVPTSKTDPTPLLRLRLGKSPHEWTVPLDVPIGAPEGASFFNWHPAYGNGKTIYLSYFHFTGWMQSKFKLVEVAVSKVSAARGLTPSRRPAASEHVTMN